MFCTIYSIYCNCFDYQTFYEHILCKPNTYTYLLPLKKIPLFISFLAIKFLSNIMSTFRISFRDSYVLKETLKISFFLIPTILLGIKFIFLIFIGFLRTRLIFSGFAINFIFFFSKKPLF